MVNVFNYMDNFIFVISLNRKIKFTNKAVMNKIKMHIDFRVQHKVNVQIIMFSNEMGVISKTDKALEILKDYQMEE